MLIAFAAGLFAYRGRIVGYVSEKWEQRKLPEAVKYAEVSSTPVIRSEAKDLSRMREPTSVGDPSASLRSAQGDSSPGLPAEFNLAIPFTSQAPFAVWDEVHDDACEEVSVMMVDAFFDGRTFTPQSANEEIYRLVDWQTQNLGHWKDTNAEETARILREKYGYASVRVIYDPTIEMIKREVAQGRPVILPAAGQMLGNRYFRQPGPLYHMLLVRGWTKSGMIITNDPGTKRGEAYLYDPEVLLNAVHDWNGGDVENGRKVMIVVEK